MLHIVFFFRDRTPKANAICIKDQEIVVATQGVHVRKEKPSILKSSLTGGWLPDYQMRMKGSIQYVQVFLFFLCCKLGQYLMKVHTELLPGWREIMDRYHGELL